MHHLDGKCSCHICWLGHLWGSELLKVRAGFKRKAQEQIDGGALMRRCNNCFEPTFPGSRSNSKHICVGKKAVIENLKAAIPQETRLLLALDTLKEISGGAGDSTLKVQSLNGGKATTISLGNHLSPGPSQQLNHSEVQTMATDSHLTGGQVGGVMANLRSKFGLSFVESGLDKQLAVLNGRFLPYFSCTRTHFEKGSGMVEKPLFFCNNTLTFMKEVARLRGHEWDQLMLLVQGDSGQKWFKLSVSMIHLIDLVEDGGKRRRRTRDDGIGGGVQHKSYGVRKILVLALVQGVPESSFNLEIIFRCRISSHK